MNRTGCRTPTVQNCLNCKKKRCDVLDGIPLHESEIIAEINVGMMPPHALIQHRRRAATRKPNQNPARRRGDINGGNPNEA